MASNAIIIKPKNNPRKTPAENIAKGMAASLSIVLQELTNLGGPENQAGETVASSHGNY